MRNLESIVPPLELCKLIPAGGEFEDSVLVWDIHGHGKFDKWHVEKRVNRSVRFGDYGIMSPPHADIPAPTLAEILAKLPEGVQMRMRTARNRERHFQIYHYSYETWTNLPAAAALRLWLRVRREDGR